MSTAMVPNAESLNLLTVAGYERCQSCGGFRHASLQVTCYADNGYYELIDVKTDKVLDRLLIDLCADCIRALADGRDITVTHLVEVTP